MALRLLDLDAETRRYMLDEVEFDAARGTLYISSRLNGAGRIRWLELLREAVEKHDDVWLAGRVVAERLLNAYEERRTKNGTTTAKIPVNAHETLAEGEFNRFYLRGISRRAIAEGLAGLEIYRAKAVERPRSESQIMIGKICDPAKLLSEIRTHPGIDTALGLPPGPNSGLSAKIKR